jgi:hypothetical protein
LGFAYLGYKLFVQGVYERAGELKAAWGDKNLVLKQAAPGTFFALFGVAVIAISIFRGTGLNISEKVSGFRNIAMEDEVVRKYPIISKLLEEEELQIEGSWDKAYLELAVLHNIRAIWQQTGIPGESFRSMFHDALVPILKQKPSEQRGSNIEGIKKYLLYSINTHPAANPQSLEQNPLEKFEMTRDAFKAGLGVH